MFLDSRTNLNVSEPQASTRRANDAVADLNYFQNMKPRRYPTVEQYLLEKTQVHAWTIDDLVKSLKRVDDGLRKIEVNLAKDPSWATRSDQKKLLNELQTQFKKISEQLNRLLGASF